MIVAAEELRSFGAALLDKAGCGVREAMLVADALVDASLAGHDSHGVVRFPQYLEALERGEIVANRHAELRHDLPALAIFDGGFGFGQVVGREAVEYGIALARRSGAAVVGLGRSGHLGRLAGWAKLAADAGQISLHFVNVPGGLRVAPHGARESRFGTNPISAGVPIPGAEPILLDLSTAAVPVGRVQVAKNRGERVAPGLLLDRDGRPTQNPAAMFEGVSILPIAGHRGSGLSLVAELLAGAMTGGGASAPARKFLYNNMLSIFIDTTTPSRSAEYAAEAKRYIDWVRASPPVDPAVSVLLPGDRLRQAGAERARSGIPVDDVTARKLRIRPHHSA
ncbi:MAG: Ldh family oxidoreductase [Alphaproteobacteria bacterium]|nr:Ldh family oxidoreductase [Alphaproteobacteria bacterium]